MSESKCKHINSVPAGYEENMPYYSGNTLKVQSLYCRYCKDCGVFYSCLDNEIIKDGNLIPFYY